MPLSMPHNKNTAWRQQRTIQFGNKLVGNAAILAGAGTSTAPLTNAAAGTADRDFINFRVTDTGTTGTVRLRNERLYIGKAGQSGETARFYTIVNAVAAGSGGVHGVHATAQLGATGASATAGLMVGIRATLAANAVSRILGGNLAALQVDSDLGTGNTMPSTTSFIRVADNGAVSVANFLHVATTGCLKGSGCGTTPQDALKCNINGTVRYIPLMDAS